MSKQLDGLVEDLISAWEAGDVYLRLSALGVAALVLLWVLIYVAWMRYGSDISAVFAGKSKSPVLKEAPDDLSQISDSVAKFTSYRAPWQDETFPLSPETRRLDEEIKEKKDK